MNQDNEVSPHRLAEKFEQQIKAAITNKFSGTTADDLRLLTDKEDGVYISEADPGTLCCLVVGLKDKYLYLVTGDIVKEKTELKHFNAMIVS